VTGLGRTKIYELIGNGRVTTTTVGRRRLIIVQSLLALVGVNATPADPWIGSRLLMTVTRIGPEADDSTSTESIVELGLNAVVVSARKSSEWASGLEASYISVVRWKPRLLSGVMCSMPRASY
jgi:hypothetical protein